MTFARILPTGELSKSVKTLLLFPIMSLLLGLLWQADAALHHNNHAFAYGATYLMCLAAIYRIWFDQIPDWLRQLPEPIPNLFGGLFFLTAYYVVWTSIGTTEEYGTARFIPFILGGVCLFASGVCIFRAPIADHIPGWLQLTPIGKQLGKYPAHIAMFVVLGVAIALVATGVASDLLVYKTGDENFPFTDFAIFFNGVVFIFLGLLMNYHAEDEMPPLWWKHVCTATRRIFAAILCLASLTIIGLAAYGGLYQDPLWLIPGLLSIAPWIWCRNWFSALWE